MNERSVIGLQSYNLLTFYTIPSYNFPPCYVYEKGTEIDFLTAQKTLIEVKYHGLMTSKQQDLFRVYPAKNRLILTGIKDLEQPKISLLR